MTRDSDQDSTSKDPDTAYAKSIRKTIDSDRTQTARQNDLTIRSSRTIGGRKWLG